MISSEHAATDFYALDFSATIFMPIPDFSHCFVWKLASFSNMLWIVLEPMVYVCKQLSEIYK